jgi:hypothetical protein
MTKVKQGSIRKGGINPPPKYPRPDIHPKGQGR